MSRTYTFVLASVLVASVAGASAHEFTRPASVVSAYAGTVAAQSDDLAARVKVALKADADLGSASEAVTVTAAGGVVTLEGTVPTVQIRARIAEFVMKQEGVTKVANKMKLAKK